MSYTFTLDADNAPSHITNIELFEPGYFCLWQVAFNGFPDYPVVDSFVSSINMINIAINSTLQIANHNLSFIDFIVILIYFFANSLTFAEKLLSVIFFPG